MDRKAGLGYVGYDLGGCSCVIFRGAVLIIYDTGESTEEVHQGSAEIRLFTEEVTQWRSGREARTYGGEIMIGIRLWTRGKEICYNQ